MDALQTIDDELQKMQHSSDAAEATLEASASDASILDLGLRSQLAALHGNINSLVATRIDALLVGDLITGKETARCRRKSLIKRAENLIERVEGQVSRFDGIRSGAMSSTHILALAGEEDDIVMY